MDEDDDGIVNQVEGVGETGQPRGCALAPRLLPGGGAPEVGHQQKAGGQAEQQVLHRAAAQQTHACDDGRRGEGKPCKAQCEPRPRTIISRTRASQPSVRDERTHEPDGEIEGECGPCDAEESARRRCRQRTRHEASGPAHGKDTQREQGICPELVRQAPQRTVGTVFGEAKDVLQLREVAEEVERAEPRGDDG